MISKTSDHNKQAIPASLHAIESQDLSKHALKILKTLHADNCEAYLVGGCVRDLLLNRHPKDFDLATSAHPEKIKQLFHNARLIGKRFRLAHIYFHRELLEVATFRAAHTSEHVDKHRDQEGMILRDNVYGTLEEDVWRRDFTVNALYYDIRDHSIIDYTGGLKDLADRQLRIIGDPDERYREDPGRMLRAVRFSAKLGFEIEAKTAAPIFAHAERINQLPAARLYIETNKILESGYAYETFQQLKEYKLLQYLFPQTAECLDNNDNTAFSQLIDTALKNTDHRIKTEQPTTPAFSFAVLLWQPLLNRIDELIQQQNMPEWMALQTAMTEVIREQSRKVSLPRRISLLSREIWHIQFRLLRRTGKRAWRTVENTRFRAGIDFLQLRSLHDESLVPLYEWWKAFYESSAKERHTMMESLSERKNKKKGTKQEKPESGQQS